ncbi:hypothetical protein pipiens_014769 [Culex pipiens pipiens]|uniref:Uncharacterized protein n=1 Tax=Culex pipiens pipiens TaxID=38569 RepID=A0ABD1CU80_CULPP
MVNVNLLNDVLMDTKLEVGVRVMVKTPSVVVLKPMKIRTSLSAVATDAEQEQRGESRKTTQEKVFLRQICVAQRLLSGLANVHGVFQNVIRLPCCHGRRCESGSVTLAPRSNKVRSSAAFTYIIDGDACVSTASVSRLVSTFLSVYDGPGRCVAIDQIEIKLLDIPEGKAVTFARNDGERLRYQWVACCDWRLLASGLGGVQYRFPLRCVRLHLEAINPVNL